MFVDVAQRKEMVLKEPNVYSFIDSLWKFDPVLLYRWNKGLLVIFVLLGLTFYFL